MGIESFYEDGNDVLKCYSILSKKINEIKKNPRPIFIEFTTYRWREHCGPNYDNNIGYRSEKEYLFWKKKDPLLKTRNFLLKKRNLKKKLVFDEKKINLDIKKAFNFAKKSKFPNQVKAYKGEYASQK